MNLKFASLLILSTIVLIACGQKPLTIESFEKIGFKKDNQPFFRIVGAKDGWKGDYKNERAEIYFYEDPTKIPVDQLKRLAGDFSRKFCTIRNAAIIENEELLCVDAAKL